MVACLGYAALTAQHDPKRAAVLVLVVAMLGYGAVRLGGVPSAFAALRRNDLASAKRLLDQTGTRFLNADSRAKYAWVQAALERVATGRVLLIDYGTATTVELVGRPFIRTYRNHTVGHRVGPETNAVDITVDVPFDQLPRGAVLATQAAWLEGLGIGELVDEGRRVWTERAHVGDLAAVRARSRVGEAEALCDPKGLGGFIVAEWAPGTQR